MLGKALITIGIVLVILGLLMLYGERVNFFGKLPGDFTIRKENFTLHFPLTTSLILSIFLSLVLFIIQKLR